VPNQGPVEGVGEEPQKSLGGYPAWVSAPIIVALAEQGSRLRRVSSAQT
jgi:hypothetical protein